MILEEGDPVIQFYFRLGGLLYRSSVDLVEGREYVSRLERRLMDVWENVPGTDVLHKTEKKAVSRAKKLLEPLLHSQLIGLAYWTPEDVTPAPPELCVRVSPGSVYFAVGDYEIRPDGPLYTLSKWGSSGPVPICPKFFTLEAAAIAAVIRAKADAKLEETEKPSVPTTEIVTTPFEQESVTDDIERDLRNTIDSIPDGQDRFDYELDLDWGQPTERD